MRPPMALVNTTDGPGVTVAHQLRWPWRLSWWFLSRKLARQADTVVQITLVIPERII